MTLKILSAEYCPKYCGNLFQNRGVSREVFLTIFSDNRISCRTTIDFPDPQPSTLEPCSNLASHIIIITLSCQCLLTITLRFLPLLQWQQPISYTTIDGVKGGSCHSGGSHNNCPHHHHRPDYCPQYNNQLFLQWETERERCHAAAAGREREWERWCYRRREREILPLRLLQGEGEMSLLPPQGERFLEQERERERCRRHHHYRERVKNRLYSRVITKAFLMLMHDILIIILGIV